MKKLNENGRSMIEMLGVLAIIGVLSVGGFSLINKMQVSHEKNQVIDELGNLASRVRTVIRDYDGSTGVTKVNQYIRNAKAFPDVFLNNDAGGSNAFNGSGDVTFNVYYLGKDTATYAVEAADISEEMCMEIVTTNWGNSGTSGLVALAVKASGNAGIETKTASATLAKPGDKTYPAPMSITNAVTACNGVESSKSVYLIYR